MNYRNERLCTHTGLLYCILLGLGLFTITGWLPPVDPSLSADSVTAIFNNNRMNIRIGVTVLAMASVLWWPFSGAIAMQMRRIEGAEHPLTYVQMASATGTVLGVILPAYLWLAAAYRPELLPNTLQLFNDFAWLVVIGMFPPAIIQCGTIALAIFSDKREKPLYPRWVAYMNIWAAIGFLPGALLPFFHTGPFTWAGLIGFWMVAVIFFGWILLMWWMTLQASAIHYGHDRQPQ